MIKKAQVNDIIRSYNVGGMPERGYFMGIVTKVEIDPMTKVEYVYYDAFLEVRGETRKAVDDKMRVKQNGTESLFEPAGYYNNIEIY